jgi:hypothetical protein
MGRGARKLRRSARRCRRGLPLSLERFLGERSSGSQLQDLVLGADDVLIHKLAGCGRITTMNGRENFRVFSSRHFAVVPDIYRGKHNAFHLATNIADGSQHQPVAG